MGDKVIEVKDLVKEYKQLRAVDGISFDVYEKEIFGLLGPNGSGKSTTINSVLSLLKYSSGSIKLFGREMTPDAYDLKRDTGVIFQDVAVFSELNVYENIDYFLISKTGIDVKQYRIIRTTYNGVYPSDHYPIMLKINLK